MILTDSNKQRLIVLCSFMMAFLLCSKVSAETIDCTELTSLPTTINQQGVYCLRGNLATNISSGNAITISVNNVTIDLNGFKLGGQAAGSTTDTKGIYAANRKNITIKNGIIRGFKYGIYLKDLGDYTSSASHLIEDILADQNRVTAIWVEGTNSIVRNSRVFSNGGWVDSDEFYNTSSYGIYVRGPLNRLLNNEIGEVFSIDNSYYACGIYLREADGAIVQDNRITNINKADGGYSFGIRTANTSGTIYINNTIVNNSSTGTHGISSGGTCIGNVTSNYATGIYVNCTDSGGNVNVAP